jgi:hypothetical protein
VRRFQRVVRAVATPYGCGGWSKVRRFVRGRLRTLGTRGVFEFRCPMKPQPPSSKGKVHRAGCARNPRHEGTKARREKLRGVRRSWRVAVQVSRACGHGGGGGESPLHFQGAQVSLRSCAGVEMVSQAPNGCSYAVFKERDPPEGGGEERESMSLYYMGCSAGVLCEMSSKSGGEENSQISGKTDVSLSCCPGWVAG